MSKRLAYSGEEAAELIGVHPNRMAELRRDEGLPYIQLRKGGRCHYPADALAAWIADRTRTESRKESQSATNAA